MSSRSSTGDGPVVILGAGYSGIATAQQISRQSRRAVPVVLVDRRPVHVLRTELYEIGRIASEPESSSDLTVPLAQALQRTSATFRTGTVQGIDLDRHTVQLDSGSQPFGALTIALGSVAAYYGVPGAAEHTHQVYHLEGAKELAHALLDLEARSPAFPPERSPRIVIIGGGSTGTELAAEIATTDWSRLTATGARPPEVWLLTGALPFLAGFAPGLIAHARTILRRSGVLMLQGVNVAQVEPQRVFLQDGSVLATDLVVWCAGLQAPEIVKNLPFAHGKGGRLVVEPTLELPDHPGIFGVGDVVELKDPETGLFVPGTAQAALAEAKVAGRNIVARWTGKPLTRFAYHERGTIVALGVGRASGSVNRVTVWGSPAALLKRLVQRDYAKAIERGGQSTVL